MKNNTNHSNLSFWQKQTPIKINTTKHLAQNKVYDLVIVGLGLMGAWLAYWLKLKYKNLSILIVEKGSGPDGASVRNAGFACSGSAGEMLANLYSMEKTQVLSIVEKRIKGISLIRQTLGDTNIGYNPCGGYECLSGSFSFVADKLGMLNEYMSPLAEDKSVFRVCQKSEIDKFGFQGFRGMIHNKLEGSLNSSLLMKSLIQKIMQMGISVCTNFEVKRFEEGSNAVRVISNEGTSFIGRKVFVCTNGFTQDFCPKTSPINPGRGQILVTSVISNWKVNGTFHFNKGYDYCRNVNGRLLLGGGRDRAIEQETTTKMETSEPIQNYLEKELLPNILPGRTDYTIDYRWAGIMGFTNSHQPLWELLSPYSKIYVGSACNGMGVSTIPSYTKDLVEKLVF